jgi:hypothetical protein
VLFRRTPTTGGEREGSPHHTQQVQEDCEDESPAENVRKDLVDMHNTFLPL